MTTRLTWPAERFYWTVLDAPGLRQAGELPMGLLMLFQEDLPVELDTLHAVGVPLADGRVAVCAAERSELAAIPADCLSLMPESVPAFIGGEGVAPAHFNLLIGSFEPRPIRMDRMERHAFAAGAVLLCGLLLAVGLHRRASHWRDLAGSANAAVRHLARTAGQTGRPVDLTAEAARLRGTREALAKAAPPPDAALSLAAVLRAWPASAPSRPQSISVSPTAVAVSVSIEGDPAAFLKAFAPPAGWTLDEPRLNTADKVTRLSFQLRSVGGTGGTP
ncbi:MAG: hypothetical protein ACK4WH_09770 [Phycisphaerales bacterium]